MFNLDAIISNGKMLGLPEQFYDHSVRWSVLDEDGNTHMLKRVPYGIVYDFIKFAADGSGCPQYEDIAFIIGNPYDSFYRKDKLTKDLGASLEEVYDAYDKMICDGVAELKWSDHNCHDHKIWLVDQHKLSHSTKAVA